MSRRMTELRGAARDTREPRSRPNLLEKEARSYERPARGNRSVVCVPFTRPREGPDLETPDRFHHTSVSVFAQAPHRTSVPTAPPENRRSFRPPSSRRRRGDVDGSHPTHTFARGFAAALASLVHHAMKSSGSLLLRQVGLAVVAGVGRGHSDRLRGLGKSEVGPGLVEHAMLAGAGQPTRGRS